MLSGKILHPADWFRLFQAILDAPIVEEAVLTVVSDEVSGSIGVRQGRWIMGASTSTGLKGALAVRQLISLPTAQFGYLDAQKVKVRASINQQLQVDIGALLNDPTTPIVDNPAAMPEPSPAPAPISQPLPPAIKAPRPLHEPAANAQSKAQTPAEIATAELRKTFDHLRPVSPYYQSQVPPPPPGGGPKPGQSGIRPAIAMPPKVVSPPAKPSGGYNPWGDDESDAQSQENVVQQPPQPASQQAQQPPSHMPPPPPPPPPGAAAQQQNPGGAGFEFDPSNLAGQESGTGRKRVNPLDKLIYGAASTCMKLTSLKAREKQQQEAAAQQAAQQQAMQAQGQQQSAEPASWNPWGGDDDAPPPQFNKPTGAFAQLMPGQRSPQSAPPAPPQHPGQEAVLQQPGFAPPLVGEPTEPAHEQPWQPPQQQQPMQPPQHQQFQPTQQQPTQPSQQQPMQPQHQQNQQPGFAQSPQHPTQQPPHHQTQQPMQHPNQPAAHQPQAPHQQGHPQSQPPQNFAPSSSGPDYPTSPASPAPNSGGYVHPLEQHRRSQPFERRDRTPEQPGPPPDLNRPAPVPPQPHPHVATVMPHVVAPPLDPAEARNLVDAVRATAWRIASRVAYEAKLRMEQEDEKQFSTQRLRTIEHATASVTEQAKARKQGWSADGATIAFAACVVLGIGVLAGGFILVRQQSGNAPYVASGKKYLNDGRDDLAAQQFTLAIERDPQDADAVQMRAEIYEKMKDWEHASADYARLWELKPKHYDAARKAAFYLFKQRKYDDGLSLAKKLLAAKPDDASARAQIVMNLSRSGRYDDAIVESAQVDNDLVPPYLVPDFFGGVGFAYEKKGDLKQAIAMYTKALEGDPQNETNLEERAAAFMSSKDYKKAAEDYKALTTLFPARAGGWADYGKAAMLAGDTKTAAKNYEEAIKLSPSVLYYVQLAQCDMANNNFGHAVYDCDCALKLQPTCFEAAHIRAAALQKAKSEKAIVIAKITPDFVMQSINAPAAHKPPPNIAVAGQDPLTQGGYQMLLQKNWKAASEILATAIKRTPRDWSARRFYAAAMMEMGRYGEAMQSFDVMASNRAILPSDEMAYAECAAKAGKTERALELYNGCLNRDPTFLEARVAMIRLCVQKGFASKAQQLVKEGTTMQPATKDTLQKALAGN